MQQDLFNALSYDPFNDENAPSLDMALELIAVVNQCIRVCPWSREQVIDRINLCLRESESKITKIQINKWLSPSQANAIPAWTLPAICWAVDSDQPFQTMLQPLRRKVVHNVGDKFRELNETKIVAAEQIRQAKALEKQMQQMLEGKY